MLKNSANKLSHHLSVDNTAKSTEKTPPTKCVREEVGTSDFLTINSATHSGVNNNVSHKNSDVTHTVALHSNATRSINTSLTSSATGATPASTNQDELVQKILDAADMASKTQRVNQLLSYISGIDYSPAPGNTYKPPRNGSDGSNDNEYSLV